MKVNSKVLALSTLIMGVGFAAGCANTAEMKRIEETANSAESAADQAQRTASEAMAAADEAKMAAQRAMETANEGLRVAEDANTCCAETNEKLDRAFRSSMAK